MPKDLLQLRNQHLHLEGCRSWRQLDRLEHLHRLGWLMGRLDRLLDRLLGRMLDRLNQLMDLLHRLMGLLDEQDCFRELLRLGAMSLLLRSDEVLEVRRLRPLRVPLHRLGRGPPFGR